MAVYLVGQENANQNHNEMPLYSPTRMVKIKESLMLRVETTETLLAMLVGV